MENLNQSQPPIQDPNFNAYQPPVQTPTSSQNQIQPVKTASKTPLIIIGIFVLALGAAAIMFFTNTKSEENSDGNKINSPIVVKTTKATTKTTSTPTQIPTTVPSDQAYVEPTIVDITKPTVSVTGIVTTPKVTPSIQAPTPTPTLTATPKPSVIATKYKNGSYTVTTKYGTPAGDETNEVTLVLESDVIKSSDFSVQSGNSTSKNLQQKFKSNYKSSVVGKSLDSVSLSVIGGASLTTRGFMDALKQIKSKAKS